jgi:hypothetical protein
MTPIVSHVSHRARHTAGATYDMFAALLGVFWPSGRTLLAALTLYGRVAAEPAGVAVVVPSRLAGLGAWQWVIKAPRRFRGGDWQFDVAARDPGR